MVMKLGSRRAVLLTWSLLCGGVGVANATESASPQGPAAGAQSAQTSSAFYVKEYRVRGARLLNQAQVGEAVYPYLGPARTAEDCEKARAALEKAYQDKGFQTVTVQIPQQDVKSGIIILQVVEARVGRLRVKGSRYFTLNQIKQQAPSLAEGTVVNFSQVTRDIVGLNQLSDLRVTPALRAGVEPGTVDIDLDVKDTLPLHGTLELNNRYSVGTSQLRLNGSVSYDNLWHLGHSLGFSFQLAPENLSDAEVFSAYYLARIPNVSWLGLMLEGTRQDSNVSTLGGAAVAGRGEIAGFQAIITLPPADHFFHSLTLGIDYKHFDQNVTLAGGEIKTPIDYFPFSGIYTATWAGKGYLTQLDSSVTFQARGTGSSPAVFDKNRFNSDGSFLYFRGDLSHTHDLPKGFQVFGKVQGPGLQRASHQQRAVQRGRRGECSRLPGV